MERHRAAVRARLLRSTHARPGPGSITWTINREAIVVAGWGRAILLQLAHPAIAAGVHDHSAFRGSMRSGVQRLRSTVGAMLSLTFGDTEQMIAAAAGINAIHDRVRGPVGEGSAATYSAHDPHLQRWVHATLLDSIPLTYDVLVGPLTPRERDRYCSEAAIMEPLLGMPEGWLPRDTNQLDGYMREMLDGGTLVISDKARALARAMLYPAYWRFAWPMFRGLQLLTIGSLPPAIREAYGFEWRARDARAFIRWTAVLRSTLRLLPSIAREWPIARRHARPFTRKTAWNPHMKLPMLGAAAMLAGTTAYAQDPTAGIDRIFSWSTPTAPGCVVAASRDGNVVVNRAYGSADLERNVPLTTSSVMDVASVVKQFVAASTLMLVEAGKLSLSEDIHKYIPELPDYGHTITLDHLLTHTSGIRDWTGLGPLTGREIDALTVTLRQRGLNFAPGEEWSYSNGGYVLLKEIVARVSGVPFAEFTRTRLFEPLGMKSTSYVVDIEHGVSNRALAYEKIGNEWRQNMQVGNQRGGGGALFSTASDLLIWNDALVNARLGGFVTAKLHEPAKLNNGRTLTYARGLHIDSARGDKVIWHSGGSAGYSSMLARHPEGGVSVAVTCNAGDSAPSSQYARRVFDVLMPSTASSPDAATPPSSAGAVVGLDYSNPVVRNIGFKRIT